MTEKLDIFTRIRNDEFKNKSPLFNRAAYNAESGRLEGLFKAALFEEFGVTGHPKADKCYSLAWEHGHASGYSDVANYFADFVELIK